jgi:hypothetical protein
MPSPTGLFPLHPWRQSEIPNGPAGPIDAGNRDRALNPIVEFLNRTQNDGVITSLDFTIAPHYDADHRRN